MSFLPQKVEINADVLVIGGGLAGLMSAIEAARIVDKVVVVTKGKMGRSGNTIMSRNGMSAVMEEGYDGDSVQKHVQDTLAAGRYINNTRMVHVFAEKAGQAIKRLIDLGVPFLRENGTLLRKGSPGNSCRRFLTVDGSFIKSPQTQGLALTLPLAREAAGLGVYPVEGVIITNLLKYKDRVVGAQGLDKKEEKIWVFKASVVILACGGAGGLYPATTNSADVTGDGYALALIAGAPLRDMEFIQFHPAVALGQPRMVMSTAPFADGAVLRNRNGERYMARYSPQMEMATRDVMARANFAEINAGRGTESGGVYMDFTSIPEKVMQKKYSDLYSYMKGRRVIEVAPAMHFMMGGIEVDETGRTAITGLYAAGETAGGLHGANRLAGNALTEAAVFGMLAGREAALEAKKVKHKPRILPKSKLPETVKDMQSRASAPEEINSVQSHTSTPVGTIRKALRKIMGEKVALVRKGAELKAALNEINNLKKQLSDAKLSNWKEILEYHQVLLMLETGKTVAEAALAREKSLGAHYREDL